MMALNVSFVLLASATLSVTAKHQEKNQRQHLSHLILKTKKNRLPNIVPCKYCLTFKLISNYDNVRVILQFM